MYIGTIDENAVIKPPAGWVEYDCQSKKGVIGLRWHSYFGHVNLATINFSLLKDEKQTYCWNINNTGIKRANELIANDNYAKTELYRALSLITDNAMYTTTLKNDPSNGKIH
jgi:hypothetical protein